MAFKKYTAYDTVNTERAVLEIINDYQFYSDDILRAYHNIDLDVSDSYGWIKLAKEAGEDCIYFVYSDRPYDPTQSLIIIDEEPDTLDELKEIIDLVIDPEEAERFNVYIAWAKPWDKLTTRNVPCICYDEFFLNEDK